MLNTRIFPFAVLALLAACASDVDAPAETYAPALPVGPVRVRAGEVPVEKVYAWTDRSEVFVPRMVSATVDQPSRARVLVYGGWQENGVRGDTWEWDGYGWIRRQPLHDAGRRAGAAIVFDEVRSRALMVGGASVFFPVAAVNPDPRTWEWDGHDWSAIATATNPTPSMGAAATWDPVGNRMLLFGGFGAVQSTALDGGSVYSESNGTDEMWTFDGLDWKRIQRTEPWPPARGLSSMVWDRGRNRLILFSGRKRGVFQDGKLSFGNGDGASETAAPLADTWEWDGTRWSEIVGARPLQAGSGTLFWDPLVGEVRLILDTLDVNSGNKIVPGLFRRAGDTWEQLSLSPDTGRARTVTSAVWSSANQRPFVFAGVTLGAGGSPNADVSLLELLAGDPWEVQPPPAQMVPLTRGSGATQRDGSVLLFGGVSGSSYISTTYRWNGGRWTILDGAAAGPPPAARASATVVPSGSALTLFGGRNDSGLLADTWIWNGATWTLSDSVGPGKREDAVGFGVGASAYLFGGRDNDTLLADTWRFQGGAWTPIPGAPDPGLRAQPCSASTGTTAILSGGVPDVWVFDGTAWTPMGSSGVGNRAGCSMAFAPTTGETLLVGGSGAEATQDLVQLAPSVRVVDAITEDSRVDLPVRRRGALFTANPISGGLLLSGGIRTDNSQQLADTWQLRILGQACTSSGTCGNGVFCTEGRCCEQSTCGPCGTCGSDAKPGLCKPRPPGPVLGCDGALACNADGQCRVGPGGPCAEDAACASGACIKSGDSGTGICCGVEGCTLQCLDDDTLRNPDGTAKECAPYTCEGQSCKQTCASIKDCTGSAICTGEGKCVLPVESDAAGSSCGCEMVGAPAGGSLSAIVLAALAVRWRRRVSTVNRAGQRRESAAAPTRF